MENTPALFLIGTILAFTLMLSTGTNIYNTADSTIENSLYQMSAQEIEAFNYQFENYKGEQTGSQISALSGRLIANSNTYADEPDMVPSVECKQIDKDNTKGVTITYNSEEELEEYMEGLVTIKNNIENKHIYNVSFEYSFEGLLNKVIIEY